MRIVAGHHRGLRLNTPEKGAPTRPTTDRAREALFSVIATDIFEARFLDLYSGTGANGLEAYSRGAKEVVLIERHPKAIRCIQKNLKLVDSPSSIRLIKTTVEKYLLGDNPPFDLVFADPPFAVPPDKVLAFPGFKEAIRPGGRLFIEYRRDRSQKEVQPPEAPEGFTHQKTYKHGEAGLSAYRRDIP